MSSHFDKLPGPSGYKRIKHGCIEPENSWAKKLKLEYDETSQMSQMSCDFYEQPGPCSFESLNSQDIESQDGPVKQQQICKEHDASRTKSTYHGIVYQLKLLILFLNRGLKKNYRFTLTTEMMAAEKFDDIVFGYTTKRGDVCRFLQVKHKQKVNEKITLTDLLAGKDDDFSLKKYFLSYLKIKQCKIFEGYKLKDFVISTNIDLDEKLKLSFKKTTSRDNILHFDSCRKDFERYKIGNLDVFPEKKTLKSILLRTSQLSRLANVLAFYTYRNKCLDLADDLLKAYHAVLGAKVIERVPGNDGGEVGKFRQEFTVAGKAPQLKRFREAFYEEYVNVSKKKLDEDKFWQKMQEKELNMSSSFGVKFDLIKDPKLTSPDLLADEIAKLINDANERSVKIVRKIGRNAKLAVINCNIDKLGGHVFVKKDDENNKNNDYYYFSSGFLNEDENLPANLNVFRAELKNKLRPDVEFSDMSRYKFHIPNFKTKTCEERQLCSNDDLPDDHIDEADIDDFLQRLVFSVNQPDEIELGHLIEKELGEHFNLIDSELMAAKLQKDMLDWMKQKKGNFITNEDGRKFFDQLNQKTSKLVLIGPTLIYRAEIEQFQLSFQDDLIELQNFLNPDSQLQIFNLINSHETIIGSIKVYQTLKKLDTYRKSDNYIFTSLRNVLLINNYVMKAFLSESSTYYNLLVIECKAGKKIRGQDQLYAKLAEILTNHKNKKIILITSKNDTFAQKFKDKFSPNNLYKEIQDLKNNLNDLSEKSQTKILTQAKILFQGKEVNLGSVLDKKSTHILSGDVLSMLINDKTIQIGKSLMDSRYEEVKDYFVNRTFGHYLVIKKVILKEKIFLVIEGGEKNDNDKSNENSGKDILLVSGTGDNFKKLCEKFPNRNIHWLKKKSNQLIWQKSRGDLTNLRDFVDTREQCITKYTPKEITKITDISDKVFLLAAEAGMGKSVILSHLALTTQKASPSVWIIRSNLLDYSSVFYEWLTNSIEINELQAMKFLCEFANFQHFKYSEEDDRTKKSIQRALIDESVEIYATKTTKGLSLLEIKLFVRAFHHGKVMLLFDGFDEISPDFNDVVVKLLKVFNDTKVKKIWLTTRPYNIQSEPEDTLSTFSYVLIPFVKEEQHDFLLKFWSKNLPLKEELSKSRADIFINELINRLSVSINDPDQKFLSIPIQIFMIATVFSEEFEKFYNSGAGELSPESKNALDEKLDLVTLYENFVRTIFNVQRGKNHSAFDSDKDKPDVKRETEKQLAEFKEKNKKLAIYSMLKKNQLEKILSKEELREVDDLMINIGNAEQRTGLVSKIINNNPKEMREAIPGRNKVMITEVINNKPVFIHRTFAEYFAAHYIWDKFNSIGYEKFKTEFIQNILIGILMKSDFIQVCKFLQPIAKDSFRFISFDANKSKKMDMLFVELAKQVKEYGSKKTKPTPQSAKILLGIIDFSLLQQNYAENCFKIRDIFKINTNNAIKSLLLKLLCVCAEMGYIGLAKELKKYVDDWRFSFDYPKFNKSYSELLLEHLKTNEWNHSPLWIASENNYLNMVEFLIRDLSYKITWKDKNGADLIQRIFSISEFSVLKSCVELGITNGEPFNHLDNVDRKKLPIYEALKANAPSEVIKLLMEKTDVNLINNFADCDLKEMSVKEHVSLLLLQYDKEIIELAIKKGVDLSSSVNKILSQFTSASLLNPINDLINGHGVLSAPFFNSDTAFYNVFPTIDLLLKTYTGRRRNNFGHAVRQCAEQAYHIHQLLNDVYRFQSWRNVKTNDPRNLLLKLIVNGIRQFAGFKGIKTIIKPDQRSISFSCDDRYNISRIMKLIEIFIKSTPFFKGFPCKYEQNEICISLKSRTENYEKTYPTYKRDMIEMFFEYYKNGDGIWCTNDSASNAISQLKSYVVDMQNKIKMLKKHHQRNVSDTSLSTYENELKHSKNYESLGKLSKGMLSGVLYLYLRQDYERIDDAVNEISVEVWKLEGVMIRLLEMENSSRRRGKPTIYDADKILHVLDLKNNTRASEKILKRLECRNITESIELLFGVCCLLNKIGRKRLKKTLQLMCRFSDQSSRIFDLLKKTEQMIDVDDD